MRRYDVILGLLLLIAAPAWSEMFFDRFDRTPQFQPFLGFEWILLGQLPDNAAPPTVDKVLTITRTALDVNKDGFVTKDVSAPGVLIGSANPMGYEALQSNSRWGNVRVLLDVPVSHRADTDMYFGIGGGGSISASPSRISVPEPASLALLVVGVIGALRRRRG